MTGDTETFMPFSSRADHASDAKRAEICPVKQSAARSARVLFQARRGSVWGCSFNLTCDPQILKSTAESASSPCQVRAARAVVHEPGPFSATALLPDAFNLVSVQHPCPLFPVSHSCPVSAEFLWGRNPIELILC